MKAPLTVRFVTAILTWGYLPIYLKQAFHALRRVSVKLAPRTIDSSFGPLRRYGTL